MFKRFITSLFCLFLIFVSIPFFGDTQFFSTSVYADSVPDGYSPCGLNDQVDAFRSYCYSRNLAIEGSGLDAVTTFTTDAYQGLIRKSGFDINQLQNEIYKRTNDNLGAKWFFTQTGISVFNRIFAEFLQNNDLEVGDTDVNKNVYSGKIFIDSDGDAVLSTYSSGGMSYSNPATTNISLGSYYKYSSSSIVKWFEQSQTSTSSNLYSFGLEYGGGYRITTTFYGFKNGNGSLVRVSNQNLNSSSGNYIYGWIYGDYADGFISVVDNGAGYFRPCIVSIRKSDGFISVSTFGSTLKPYSATSTESANVYIVSSQINNNTYEGDTYITNEGDVINNPPAGGKDPGWNVGGGQGSYNDGQGNNYTINFPDFELPDLNIDWSIQGLGNKFPFSIPFDIVSLVTVLNAEPQAPRFQGTLDLGITTYSYDINLQQFDTVAQVCRIAELLLLVFGLILITRSIIKG